MRSFFIVRQTALLFSLIATFSLGELSAAPLLPLISKGPVQIELQQLATGASPIDLVSAGDARLFFVQQTGQIRILKNDVLAGSSFLDVSGRLVGSTGERGLLGLAFHPGYNDPSSPGFRKFYTYTSEPITGAADFTVPDSSPFDHQSVVAEWKVSAGNPDVADPTSRREVMRIDEPQANHNGGKLAFRPGEPYLYISLGDGGAGNDVGAGHFAGTGNGQSLATVLGKLLRIDPLLPSANPGSADPISGNGKYRVPASNPFINSGSAVHEIYAYGFRNPYRFSFDAPTNRLIVGDVGQNNVEEVDVVQAGKNYGWNRKEGTFLFNPANGSVSPDPHPDPTLIDPVVEYSHDDGGTAVIGGFVERGTNVPALSGLYVFGDFFDPGSNSGRLFYSDLGPSGRIQELRIGNPDRAFGKLLKGIGQDENGELYILGDGAGGGAIYRVVSIAPAPALLNLSTRLKVQTGDNVAIAGFIITGSEAEEVVLRGLGPSLAFKGTPIKGRLADPTIELHNGGGKLIATNDNWMTSPNKAELITLGLAPNDDRESALIAHLLPGAYTVILKGATGTGIGLVELYARDAAANPANISTRGAVGIGDNVLIGGFIVGGNSPRNLLLRAIGPSLAAQHISNPLLDPTLELHNENGAILQSNNNWRDTQAAAIAATGIPPSDDRESAIVTTLGPGSYTAIVRGRNNTTGIALVEAYDLP